MFQNAILYSSEKQKSKENVAFSAECVMENIDETKCICLTTNIGCAFIEDLCVFECPLAGDYVFIINHGFISRLNRKVCLSTVRNGKVSLFPLPCILTLNEHDRLSVHIGDNYLRNIDKDSSFPMFYELRGFSLKTDKMSILTRMKNMLFRK